jgi:hypothetical protein
MDIPVQNGPRPQWGARESLFKPEKDLPPPPHLQRALAGCGPFLRTYLRREGGKCKG